MPSRRPKRHEPPRHEPPADPAAPNESLLAELVATPPLSFGLDELEKIPLLPGVYIFRNKRGDILYVGKSVSLRQRVRQYFHERGDGRANARAMAAKAASVEVVTTSGEKEAILLEINLIQRHRPPYNISLADNKSYYSIKLDRSKKYPRLEFVRTRAASRQPKPRDVEMFGPFHSSHQVKKAMGELLRVFPLRSCSDQAMRNRSRPCVLHEVGKCCAPCVVEVPAPDYEALVQGARRFLQGRHADAIQALEERMLAHSEALEFEKAGDVRDRIRAVREATEAQSIATVGMPDRDAIALVRKAGKMIFVAVSYRGGMLLDTNKFVEKDMGDPDAEAMRQFLAQYYAAANLRRPPEEILLSAAPSDGDALLAFLRHFQGQNAPRRLRFHVPARGELRGPVDLALQLAEQAMALNLAGEKSREEVMEQLEKKLELSGPPRRIDCFDISQFQATNVVGVCTRFTDAEPEKAQYRKFNIRGKPDDFASMRETLSRRYQALLREGGDLPDLVLIDGGKGQLAQAVVVLDELGLREQCAVAAIAKSRVKDLNDAPSEVTARSEERVFLPGRKDAIFFRRDQQQALYLLERVRDETHRFAIATHRSLRRPLQLEVGVARHPRRRARSAPATCCARWEA
jgi:excinuclease ABC subunit C